MTDRSRHTVGGGLGTVGKKLWLMQQAAEAQAKKDAWAARKEQERLARLVPLQAEQKALISVEITPDEQARQERIIAIRGGRPTVDLEGHLAQQEALRAAHAEAARLRRIELVKAMAKH